MFLSFFTSSERVFPLSVFNGCATSATSQKFRKFQICFGPELFRKTEHRRAGFEPGSFCHPKQTSHRDASVEKGKPLRQTLEVVTLSQGDFHNYRKSTRPLLRIGAHLSAAVYVRLANTFRTRCYVRAYNRIEAIAVTFATTTSMYGEGEGHMKQICSALVSMTLSSNQFGRVDVENFPKKINTPSTDDAW